MEDDAYAVHTPTRPLYLPILAYHHVHPTIQSDMSVTPEEFRAHMRYLSQNKYTPISLDQWYSAIEHGTALPEKPVVISFDDGWLSQMTYALPILDYYGFRATFFIYTAAVGGPNALSWDQIRELHARGHEIGNHSATHSNLITPFASEDAARYADRLTREIYESKKTIEQHIGAPVRHFCYPYGYYNDAIVTRLAHAGYRSAVTVNPSPNAKDTPLLLLGRYIIAPRTSGATLGNTLRMRPLRPQYVTPHDAAIPLRSVDSVYFTAAHTDNAFTHMRMKHQWRWTDADYCAVSTTLTWRPSAGALGPGAYTFQAHAWDEENHHYTYAWLFHVIDDTIPASDAFTTRISSSTSTQEAL